MPKATGIEFEYFCGNVTDPGLGNAIRNSVEPLCLH